MIGESGWTPNMNSQCVFTLFFYTFPYDGPQTCSDHFEKLRRLLDAKNHEGSEGAFCSMGVPRARQREEVTDYYDFIKEPMGALVLSVSLHGP